MSTMAAFGSALSRIFDRAETTTGEAYMDGEVECVHGELHEFLTALLRNRVDQALRSDPRVLARPAARPTTCSATTTPATSCSRPSSTRR